MLWSIKWKLSLPVQIKFRHGHKKQYGKNKNEKNIHRSQCILDTYFIFEKYEMSLMVGRMLCSIKWKLTLPIQIKFRPCS